VTGWTYSRRSGGLMRCCLASLDEQMVKRLEAEGGPPEEGDKLTTRCCESVLLFRDGAWEWVPSLDPARHSS
jgi:hypothetical protein